jgi:hypothetical protein
MLHVVKDEAGILSLEVISFKKLSVYYKRLDDISHRDELVLWQT